MVGWWEGAGCPVRVVVEGGGQHAAEHVRATLFVGARGTSFAIAVASWAHRPLTFTLSYDWPALKALGFEAAAANAKLSAPAIAGFQPAASWPAGAPLTVQPKRSGFNEGWLLRLHAE